MVERNVLLGNRLVVFPLCSGPNSPMLEQYPEGDGEGWGRGLWQAERPTGPETGRGVSLQVTLALL